MKIKVTIGVCVRNCEKDVKSLIDRISYQDFPHEKMEVVFVDDGSQDNTLYAIHQFAQRVFSLANINYNVCHHSWKGLGYSRNILLTNANGDYIVWVDDGNIIPKDYVRKLVEYMEEHPSVGVAKGVIGAYSGSNHVSTLENIRHLVFGHKHVGKISKFPGTGGSVYRVKAAKQVGGFNKSIRGSFEDIDIAFRMSSAGWQMHIIPVTFFNKFNDKFKNSLKKSLWYGYGAHFALHKHKELRFELFRSTPLAGFLEGLLTFSVAYRLIHKKVVFLLPIYYFSERTMWCIGFCKSHIDSYGHSKGFDPVI
jgi:glycosyltransferase involved in cell wall biosynthesis